jgi:predicted small integral membrane protein
MVMDSNSIKCLFAASFSFYFLLLAFNNLSDYASNQAFVEGVLGMEDIFSNPTNQWRAISWPWAVPVFYGMIIIWELGTSFILGRGAFLMWRQKGKNALKFDLGKKWVSSGYIMSFILWFVFFVTVASEWFLMWQSEIWNAQSTAFALTGITLLLLIFHHLVPEEDQ